MRCPIAAALALAAASSLPDLAGAQASAPAIADMSYATPLAGTWSWSQTAGGSEVSFADASARTQLTIRCSRLSRFVTISRPASAAAPSLGIWTSTQTRSLPAKFDPAAARLGADLAASDPLLDAIAFSRGRFAVAIAGQPPLVAPAWADVARIVEDCRV
jgi:hypothetical protein